MSIVRTRYEKIRDTVVNGYSAIENGVVSQYQKIENVFIDTFLAHEGESTSDAKIRIIEQNTLNQEVCT